MALVNDGGRYYLLGEGSNTIFTEDFEGRVLVNQIRGIQHRETADAHIIRAGAGENWHRLVTHALAQGWVGMENLALIPGSVGASPIQNIGAYGLEAGTFIHQVEAIDIASGNLLRFTQAECEFGYRDSIFKKALSGRVLITAVTFCLPKHYQPVTTYGELAALDNPTPQMIYDTVIAVRQAKLPDPAVLGNAGSFFKNPEIPADQYAELQRSYPEIPAYNVAPGIKKVPAAWLIDKLGFKGEYKNAVRCHPTQPLVLTNTGNARGEDVKALASDIIEAVKNEFSIVLEPEVRLIGQKGLISL